MSKAILNERVFIGKREERDKQNFPDETCPSGLNDEMERAFEPIRSLCALVSLNRGGFEGMEGDIANILEGLVDSAEKRLESWENAVEKHFGRIMVERATFRNENHRPGKPLCIRVFNQPEE